MPVKDYDNQYPTTAINSTAPNLVYVMKNFGYDRISFQVNAVSMVTSRTVLNDSGVSIANDTLTTTVSHLYYTGMVVRLVSTGTLPTGLSSGTDYFVFVNNQNTITLFSTFATAMAATQNNSYVSTSPGKIDITALGTPGSTITIAPNLPSGASYSLQWSNDYVPNPEIGSLTPINAGNWFAASAGETQSVITNNITATGSSMVSSNNVAYAYARIIFSISVGSLQIQVNAKGK